MDLVITVTQDWLENNEYTNMDTAYDLGWLMGCFWMHKIIMMDMWDS